MPEAPPEAGRPAAVGALDRFEGTAIAAVLAVGVLARLHHLLIGRSLWLDEAMIGLNIGRRSFTELAGTLDFNQAAPLGFLWLEKLAVATLGLGEVALRIWPFVASVAALLVFARLARRLLAPGPAVFAISLVALSASLTYYAAEVKQYSFDVLLAATLLWLCVERDRHGRPRWGPLALAGGLGVWFSHPLVFVFPGAALYLWLRGGGASTVAGAHGPVRGGDEPASEAGEPKPNASPRRALLMVFGVWVVSFATAYFLTARDVSRSPLMARFWVEGFMPLPPTGLEEMRWFVAAFAGWARTVFDYSETVSPLRTIAICGGGVLAIVGVAAGWRRDRAELALVAAPILVALGASAAGLYPFRGRLILFLVPSTVLLMGWGLGLVAARLGRRPAAGVGVALPALSAIVLAGWIAAPWREELRPVLEEVASRIEPGDVVYLHSGVQHAYLFYERTCPACAMPEATVLRGGFLSGQEDAIRRDLAGLPEAGRVWLLFAHEWWGVGDTERRRMTELLEARGARAETVERPGASAILFVHEP